MKVVVCKVGDVPDGTVRHVSIAGHPGLAIYNIGGEFYATDDRCTHGDARLSDGEIDGDIIECPLHGGAFEIRTGKPADLPCVLPVRTYRLSRDGENILVDLDGI